MAEKTILKADDTLVLRNYKFPELPLFVISALIFLDIGILLGSMNSLRFGNEEIGIGFIDDFAHQDEIHATHWTSTLLGGVSILMLGQIYFFFSQVAEKRNPGHLLTIPVLILWLIGVAGSYLIAWSDVNQDPFVWSIKVAIAIFLFLILLFFTDEGFRRNIRNAPSLYLLLSACVWLAIAIFWRFDLDTTGSLDRVFLTSYIYGFFTLTLFGSLTFVLPILTSQKSKSNFSVYLNLVLFNIAGIITVYDDYLDFEKDKTYFALDLLGPFFWGFAAFLFIMYVFDLIYKSGVSPTLVALLIALLMFSFFVVDTLMKNIFEQWVDRRHFHFMFIGTLLVTIMAIGSRLLVLQYDPSNKASETIEIENLNQEKSTRIRTIGMVITILGVVGVLGSFTLEEFVESNYLFAAIFGFVLFIGLVTVEIVMIYQMRMRIKSVIQATS